MGVWSDGSGWCLCAGGGRSERVKGSIFSIKGAAMAAISVSSGGGSGFLIHRNLLLTTHTNLPSAATAEAVEIRLAHGRLTAKLVPHRFFITSSVLDLTIVGLDTVDSDLTSQGQQQPYCLRTCCKPSLDLGSTVYLLGHADKKDVMVGEGKVVIATDNLIKLSTDGVIWRPGTAGFDVQGNLAFMVCDPMKLASSPTTRSSSASLLSLSGKKDLPMQFGIPVPVICDWLYQHWHGSLDEVTKPKLPLTRLMSSGQRSDQSCASFTLRRVFKPSDDENGETLRTKHQQGSSSSANAKISHNENPLVDLRSTGEQGIPTLEIHESPAQKENGPVQLLNINVVSRAPKTIFLPLPLKQMLADEAKPEGSRVRNPLLESRQQMHEVPTVASYLEDGCSEAQSSCSPGKISELGSEGDRLSSGEETMYSAETMESRNIPSPKEKQLQSVGRSQSCVNYTRWTSPRSSAGHSLIPARKTHSQAASVLLGSHDYLSPTVSSSMKKRNSLEQRPARPRQSAVQASPRWM